jgi:hypothetical protein
MSVDDIVGKKFGRWTIIEYLGRDPNSNAPYFECLCDCGIIKRVQKNSLVSGDTVSCGCYQREIVTKHGMTGTPEKRTWDSIKKRCYNENNQRYIDYGGRGIIVCTRWLESFLNFYNDMGPRPKGTSLDRRDNDGNYEPGNCRWATIEEQNNNKRNNIFYYYREESLTIAQLSKKYSIQYMTLRRRMKLWNDITRAIETPVREYNKNN